MFHFPLQLCGGIWRLALTKNDWVKMRGQEEDFEAVGVRPMPFREVFPRGWVPAEPLLQGARPLPPSPGL